MQNLTFRVHQDNVEVLEDRVAKANRRLERNGIDGRFVVAQVGREVVEHEDGSAEVIYDYAINAPEFAYNGWEFLASVDVLEGGSFLRVVPGQEMPAGYVRPEGHVCEHCGVERARVKSYILRNLESGEVRQVGSSCLALFLGVEVKGLWALGFIDEELSGLGESGRGSSAPSLWSIEFILRLAYVISQGGKGFVSRAVARDYDKQATADAVAYVLTYRPGTGRFHDPEEDARVAQIEADAHEVPAEEIAAIIAWAKALGDSDYEQNVKVLVDSGVVAMRHFGTLVSVVGVRYRELERQAAREVEERESLNEWIGEVKDRLRKLPLTITKVYMHEGDFGWSTRLTLRDAEGRTLQWWASTNPEVEPGQEIVLTGTVKKHSTYEGRKITELSRCIIH